MVIGTHLRRTNLDSYYDVIVVGSGIGGLTAATVLAKSGQKVLVLERHYTAGGFTHTYERKGYEWDVGVHYIGGAHRKNSSIRRIFDYISDEKIQWSEMDPVYDRIYLGSETFDYVKGEQEFLSQMTSYFPEEKTAIKTYLKLIKDVNRQASSFYSGHVLPHWLAKCLYKRLSEPFLKHAEQTTEQVLRNLTQNKKLIAVLTGQWGDYGLPPSRSSFAMHAMVAKHYLEGACYPVGGARSLAQSIEKVLHQHHAQVVTGAEVQSIVIKGSKAIGIQLVDSRLVRAKKIISGAGVTNTFQKLLPNNCFCKKDFAEKLKQIQPSLAHMCLYIGLKVSPQDLGIPTSNLWIYPDADHDKNFEAFTAQPSLNFPVVYISFPASKDPDWEKKHPGKSTIEIVVPAPYSWFEQWKDTLWQKRGNDYETFKEKVSQHLINILLQKFPHLKSSIHYTELSTPLSTVHFAHYQHGEIYGINHNPQRFSQTWLRTDTPIKNLYLTGQDIVTCGIGGALSSGLLTAMRVLGPFRSRHLMKLLGSQKK